MHFIAGLNRDARPIQASVKLQYMKVRPKNVGVILSLLVVVILQLG